MSVEVEVGERGTAPLPSRLGIVVTRKVGNATVRNRIKRVCRECFRLWPGFVPDEVDLVVIARDGAGLLPLAAVRDEWAKARPSLLKRCASVLADQPPPQGEGPAKAGAGTRKRAAPR